MKKYKTYRNALTKIKRTEPRKIITIMSVTDLKSNTKKVVAINKPHNLAKLHDKTNNIISSIKVDNIEYHDTRDIANCFGKYYSNIGHTI